MALPIPGKVICRDFHNASLVDVSIGNQSLGNQVPQPLRGVWIDLVVVGRHLGSRMRTVYSDARSASKINASTSASTVPSCLT